MASAEHSDDDVKPPPATPPPPSPAARPAPLSQAAFLSSQLDDNPWVVQDFDGDEKPPPPPPLPAARPGPLSQAAFLNSQLADNPRLSWAWATHGKVTQPYILVVEGKWWSRSEEELKEMGEAKRRDFGHIGRIMETELGEKLEGGRRCSPCQTLDQECWVYTKRGRQQVRRPGDTCARCRVAARPGGCSVSKRKRRPRSSSPPGSRPILPKDPGDCSDSERKRKRKRRSRSPSPPGQSLSAIYSEILLKVRP